MTTWNKMPGDKETPPDTPDRYRFWRLPAVLCRGRGRHKRRMVPAWK